MSADEPPSAGPAVVGARYELLALLGAGGMGNVYKARDLELDELVALKVLRPEVAGAPGALDRFRRELKLARRVTHPNVARVFDIGELGGDKILTMELVAGESLAGLLERQGALSVSRAVEIASSICAGVGAAHAAGVVHRDLKPDNVLLGADGRVVVADFGIARAAAGGEAGRTAGGFVGTPAYMAPEQVEASATIDHRADIYAFGEILYEMLTGERAWPGDSVFAVVAARLMHPPPDPRRLRPDVEPRLAQVALTCMAKSPEERYASMQAVTSALSVITLPRLASVPPPRPEAQAKQADAHGTHKRVAVLPFRNMGPASDDYVADGLTDDLIDLLSVARGLRVRSRGVVMRHKGSDHDPREIGRELDVQIVVEGSVRRAPGSFRISARVVSVADGFQLWAKRFDGAEADMLALNDQVARAVATALTVVLEGEARGASEDPEAVDLYLRARDAYHSFFGRGTNDAAKLFDQALARSPDDPRVIAGYVMSHARTIPDVARANALRSEADRALRLAPSLPDAHVALGAVLFQLNDAAGAVGPLLRALKLAPNHAEAHDLLGRLLLEADVPAGIRHAEAALALEPNMGMPRSSLVRHFMLYGEVERAEAVMDATPDRVRALPILVNTVSARFALWHRDKKRANELLATFPEDVTGVPRNVRRLLEVTAYGTTFDESEWFALPGAAPRTVAFFAQMDAECASVLGEGERAARDLEKADAAGLYDLAWFDHCPALDPIRQTSQFGAVRARVAERAARARAAFEAGA